MIVYVHRNKEIEQNTGIFQCPSCGEQRAFKRMKIVRYYTLFFIPLFPLGTMGEFVECQGCRRGNISRTSFRLPVHFPECLPASLIISRQ
ncbi:MAG: zinc-ribbon domain-containing protein [Chloroflexota bacterium]